MAGDSINRKPAAILASDVAGCPRLTSAHGEGTRTLKVLRRDLDPKIAQDGGPTP